MRTYFRLSVEGPPVPSDGPVVLVANHPNSLLDPALVAAVARRPVRFLAKATLFPTPVIGWLVRGAGAIPVYRRQDDPALMEKNADAFAAAYDALVEGAALGIFPEGVSHDEPSIAPLRTGAARIALETAQRLGGTFPIIPVGLVFREKETFRSEARIIVGDRIAWDDLAAQGATIELARDLTARIDYALRRVTVNLESWEDAPLVDSAYAIYAAEFGQDPTAVGQLRRIRAGTRRLAELRRLGDEGWRDLAREVMRHRRLLERIRLTPADLHAEARFREVAWRAGRMLPFLTGLAIVGGAIGSLLFWPPYRLTMLTERLLEPQLYVRSTTKVLAGFLFFSLWIGAIAAAVGFSVGARAGAAVAIVLPFAAIATLRFHERWQESRHEARRFFIGRTKRQRLDELRQRQRRIAESIAELADREWVGTGRI